MTHHLLIHPQPKGRARFTRQGHCFTPAKTRDYEAAVRAQLQALFPKPLPGPLFLEVCFFLPKPRKPKALLPMVRPDLDNYLKAFLDAANGIAWADDAQLCTIQASKRYVEWEADAEISFALSEGTP
jgi:Holliday junction resolvase RusA-like endonuclease